MRATDTGPDDERQRPLQVRRADLARAVSDNLITSPQADALWAAWSAQAATASATTPMTGSSSTRPSGPTFGFTNVLYYFGGMLAVGSMSYFMVLSLAMIGAGALLALTLFNIALCLWGARALEARAVPTPAGILATLVIVMAPLAAWCLQNLAGLWPDGSTLHTFSDYHNYIDWRWLTLEATTLIVAASMMLRHRHPFMVMPIAVTIWYISMDAVSWLVHLHQDDLYDGSSWALYRNASLVFGLLTCLAAIWIDLRTRMAGSRQDFAFWLYVFGVMMFWSSMSASDSGSQLAKLAYCAINVAMVFFGAAIHRRVFTIFGGLGVTAYLGFEAYHVFEDSVWFPFVLFALGLAVVALGVLWQRRETAIQGRLSTLLPPFLRPLTAADFA